MTERSPAHPQRDAVLQASQQARANGRLIRMTVTTAGGLHRLVVTPDGRVVPLDQPSDGRPPPPAPKTARSSRRKTYQRPGPVPHARPSDGPGSPWAS